MTDCMWNIGNPLVWRLRRFQRKLEFAGISRVVVYAERQVSKFVSTWNISRSKLAVVPYRSSLYNFSFTPSDEGFLFSGGDTARDYRTLIEAVRDLPVSVVIAALRRDHFATLEIPRNVKIVSVTQQGFVALMAAARIVAVPMQGGLLHSGGHQTYLNAMAMGKPVIVADDCGADEYIAHGETGFVVTPGDIDGLRRAIQHLVLQREEAKAMGERGRQAAQAYAPERFFEHLFRLVRKIEDEGVPQ